MANQNIQIGIDLGTTNSEVAINNNNKIEVIERAGGVKYIPSVFGYDKSKNKVVGQKAYQNLYLGQKDDFENYKAEIKRVIGTSESTYFKRAELKMTPEEISAEILKSLKEDILRKYPDFDTTTAVITVPAAFSGIQSEATKRAGNLAGFDYVVLLQEPIAAAIAYGFGNSKNEKWLVYDLGGGTFDISLVSIKDGNLTVLANNGDNFLGGKNIDLEIVDKIIVPKIIEKFQLEDFKRNNDKYKSVFTKLKWAAENAKIDLSQNNKTLIELGTTPFNNIGTDDSGKEIEIAFDLSRKELEDILEPLIDRTIKLAKETLKEADIKSTSVEKIILVGGPTQIPYIKERLESDLKIKVDSSIDPLTVVANGACIYAISQKIPKNILEKTKKEVKEGTQTLSLNYESLTSENDEMVAGILDDLKDTEDEYYVQIQSDSGTYNGSKIKLKNGKFIDTVAIESNKTNLYWLYLFDNKGNSIPVEPDSFSITHGLSTSEAPLPHTIGIVIAKKDIKNGFTLTNERKIIWEKGSSLPLKYQGTYKTIRKLIKNEENNPLNILIDEGESDKPDRNFFVCEIAINGKDLPYDLPEGTEVEITTELDKSRELTVNVYIPLIDLTVPGRASFKDEIINVEELEIELNIQTEKAKNISEDCTPEEKKEIEYSIQTLEKGVQNARSDEDEKRKTNKELKDFKIILDKLEKEKELPQLIKDFNTGVVDTQTIIDEYGDKKDYENNKEQLSKIKAEGEKAILERDKTLLVRINEQIKELWMRVWFSNSQTWYYYFDQLVTENHTFINEKEAQYYFDKGRRAMENKDEEELKHCVQSLWSLLPKEEQTAAKKNLSGITNC